MRTSIIVKQKSGGTQHSAPFVLNCTPQILQRFTKTAEFIVVPWGKNSTKRTPGLSQNTVHMIFLVENVCLKFFLFGEPVCIQCKDCCFDSGVIWDTHVSSPVTIWLNMTSASL